MFFKLVRRVEDKKRDFFSEFLVIVIMKFMYKFIILVLFEYVISRYLGLIRVY